MGTGQHNQKVTNEQFLDSYNKYKDFGHGFKTKIAEELGLSVSSVATRTSRMIRVGLIPLESGVSVGRGEILKGTSTLYKRDEDTGNLFVNNQWVKTDIPKEQAVNAIREAIDDIINTVKPTRQIFHTGKPTNDDLLNVYISNDLHLGALMWKDETGDGDWDTESASETYKNSVDYLIDNSPASKVAIVVDLGDLTEMDDFKNSTPHSGHTLDVDGRYSKVIQVAYLSMVYAIEKALEKHELVKFINISGNHDITTGHAIRAFIRAWFRNNNRVTVDDSPIDIKYHKHGNTLIGFAHGDGLKMGRAGETMAVDNQEVFSDTTERYFHFGHTHKDAVQDGAICKCESHRNLAPLNHWAAHKGFRRNAGTMKAITYDKKYGEISRSLYNVNMNK
ncbi:hypothetical protein OAE88_00595 [bacterium]|nr:hypothetical protein [bacterium]